MLTAMCGLLVLAVGLTMTDWQYTSAAFTDTAVAEANAITTGTVDISASPASSAISYAGLSPGMSTTASITVTNGGAMDLRYALSATATNPDGKALKDALLLTIKTRDATTPETPCDDLDGVGLYSGDLDATSGALVGDAAQGAQAGDRALATGASEILCLVVSLPSTAGNNTQSATTTASFAFDAEQSANNA